MYIHRHMMLITCILVPSIFTITSRNSMKCRRAPEAAGYVCQNMRNMTNQSKRVLYHQLGLLKQVPRISLHAQVATQAKLVSNITTLLT
ncbi:hypothetical protein F5Y11DRAFT_318220 [Daldinia sp. FL1419]|nr:hypothetical protein F5Y11DRAFT_318220 [Daldinia sp. FL1419]